MVFLVLGLRYISSFSDIMKTVLTNYCLTESWKTVLKSGRTVEQPTTLVGERGKAIICLQFLARQNLIMIMNVLQLKLIGVSCVIFSIPQAEIFSRSKTPCCVTIRFIAVATKTCPRTQS
jgi:hypothetical protein